MVKIVKRTTLTGAPNSITQRVNAKGGIDRNFYGANGMQTKQISNNDHGNRGKHPFGVHGEHAHDYTVGKNGAIVHGSARALTAAERKANKDIL